MENGTKVLLDGIPGVIVDSQEVLGDDPWWHIQTEDGEVHAVRAHPHQTRVVRAPITEDPPHQ